MKKANSVLLLSVFVLLSSLSMGVGCTHTKDGTHVELIEMDGREAYVAGAAGIGKNKTLACRLAIQRAAKAVSHRFAQEHDDLGDELADELGARDGASFLYGYVNNQILNMPVQDISFDPSQNTCFATVRWQPPVFLKDALKKFAAGVKATEMSAVQTEVVVTEPAESAPEITDRRPNPVSPTNPIRTDSLVPAEAAVPAPCKRERTHLKRVNRVLGEKEATFNECKRRTDGDEDACYRYGLYVKKAEIAKEQATTDLQRCLETEQ